MIEPPKLSFTYDAFESYNDWVVYLHQVDNQVIWIGHCRLSDLLGAPDARKNAEWQKRVMGKQVTMVMFETYPSQNEARIAHMKAVEQNKPICNLTHALVSRSRRVQCIETGGIYATASEAARMVGVSDAAMSNHLAGKLHQQTVGGLTFKRVV